MRFLSHAGGVGSPGQEAASRSCWRCWGEEDDLFVAPASPGRPGRVQVLLREAVYRFKETKNQ